MNIIAAIAANGVIGNGEGMPWPHLKYDMLKFRKLTLGNSIVMGGNTHRCMNKLLPNRHNVIITSKEITADNKSSYSVFREPIDFLHTWKLSLGPVWCIGGAQIYEQMFPYTNGLFLTRIHQEFDGEVLFPLVHLKEFNLVQTEPEIEEKGVTYHFEFWQRKRLISSDWDKEE